MVFYIILLVFVVGDIIGVKFFDFKEINMFIKEWGYWYIFF